MEFKWRVGKLYSFVDIEGVYKLIGMVGNMSNKKYSYAVFYNEKDNKRRRIKVHDAISLIKNESNA